MNNNRYESQNPMKFFLHFAEKFSRIKFAVNIIGVMPKEIILQNQRNTYQLAGIHVRVLKHFVYGGTVAT